MHLLGGKDGKKVSRASSDMMELIAANKGAMPVRPPLAADDLQASTCSGGSSGKPKGVMPTYRVFNRGLASMLSAFEFDNDRHCWQLP